jgi:tRNA threonylcarbamoyl adenosine modification protein YeaZ
VLLAFDTSSPVVTVAVADPAGDRVLAAASLSDGLRHGELLAPAIRSVLAEAGVRPSGLTTIGVGTGPGPFTGLRVGLVTARTMADLLGIEAVGVCSLDILAREAAVAGPVAVATDARRRTAHGGGSRARRWTSRPRSRTCSATCRWSVMAPCCTPARSTTGSLPAAPNTRPPPSWPGAYWTGRSNCCRRTRCICAGRT